MLSEFKSGVHDLFVFSVEFFHIKVFGSSDSTSSASFSKVDATEALHSS